MLRSAVLTWSAVERAVLNRYSQIALVREREGRCVVRKNRKRVKHASRRALTETRRDEVPKRVRDAARTARDETREPERDGRVALGSRHDGRVVRAARHGRRDEEHARGKAFFLAHECARDGVTDADKT